jgi:hypothetical protein
MGGMGAVFPLPSVVSLQQFGCEHKVFFEEKSSQLKNCGNSFLMVGYTGV